MTPSRIGLTRKQYLGSTVQNSKSINTSNSVRIFNNSVLVQRDVYSSIGNQLIRAVSATCPGLRASRLHRRMPTDSTRINQQGLCNASTAPHSPAATATGLAVHTTTQPARHTAAPQRCTKSNTITYSPVVYCHVRPTCAEIILFSFRAPTGQVSYSPSLSIVVDKQNLIIKQNGSPPRLARTEMRNFMSAPNTSREL